MQGYVCSRRSKQILTDVCIHVPVKYEHISDSTCTRASIQKFQQVLPRCFSSNNQQIQQKNRKDQSLKQALHTDSQAIKPLLKPPPIQSRKASKLSNHKPFRHPHSQQIRPFQPLLRSNSHSPTSTEARGQR